MNHSRKLGAFVVLIGAIGAGCDGSPDAEPGHPQPAGGAGGVGGAGGSGSGAAGGGGMSCEPTTPPALVAPGSGETLPGGIVVLEWTGGEAPFQVELAFDAAFTDPVTSIPPITTSDHAVTVNGLNGGYFYWRVRNLRACGPDAVTEAREIHVTCKPIRLTDTPMIGEGSSAVAWNPIDEEYGVTLSKNTGDNVGHILFARLDRLGNFVQPPTEISGPALPPLDSGGYWGADLVYVPSNDRWVTTFHREGDDQSYIALLTDSGVAMSVVAIDDGFDSEFQSAAFVESSSRIVAMTDFGAVAWSPHAYAYGASLGDVLASADVAMNSTSGTDALGGAVANLNGVAGVEGQVIMAYDYASSGTWHIMLQRWDATTGQIVWPVGSSLPSVAGKTIVSHSDPHSYTGPNIAVNPTGQIAAVSYPIDYNGAGGYNNDVHISFVDIVNGDAVAPTIRLNESAVATAGPVAPGLAWDGEEFLTTWRDQRDPSLNLQIRLTKFSESGRQLGAGESLYPHAGWANVVATRSIVGHDRVHAITYGHIDTNGEQSDAWLCIEPPYE